MFDINRVNNNFLAQQWKKRYEEQPDEIKKKLDNLAQQDIKSYQLKVIKRSRKYPKIGDFFKCSQMKVSLFMELLLITM